MLLFYTCTLTDPSLNAPATMDELGVVDFPGPSFVPSVLSPVQLASFCVADAAAY